MYTINITDMFSGIATLVTGLIALLVYRLGKRDEQVKMARIVLSEIRNAEQQILKIKEDGFLSDFTSVLPINTWRDSNHLFVKIFDRDEFEIINQFYTAATLSEAEITKLKQFLPIAMKSKAEAIQQKLIDFACKGKNEYDVLKEEFLEIVHKEEYWFTPHSPKEKLLHFISNIQFVTTTTAGKKLKDIAKIE
jgi:hypothetical protein